MTERRIEYMPLDEVRRAARNPKRHDEPGIAASVARFGFLDPIVLDERTGRLVSGHGRLTELERGAAAGETRPDGIGQDEDGRWMVPVVRGWASRDDREAETALIGVNRLVETGAWDDRALLAMLERIEPAGYDGTGFDRWTVDDLMARIEEQELPALDGDVGRDRYGERAVRSIVLDYPTDEFGRVIEAAAKARAARHLASNAALFLALLEEHHAG